MTTFALIGLAIIALVVFLFVLEPILRAKGDEAVLDAAALPRTLDPRDVDNTDLEPTGMADDDEALVLPPHNQPAIAARRVSSDLV